VAAAGKHWLDRDALWKFGVERLESHQYQPLPAPMGPFVTLSVSADKRLLGVGACGDRGVSLTVCNSYAPSRGPQLRGRESLIESSGGGTASRSLAYSFSGSEDYLQIGGDSNDGWNVWSHGEFTKTENQQSRSVWSGNTTTTRNAEGDLVTSGSAVGAASATGAVDTLEDTEWHEDRWSYGDTFASDGAFDRDIHDDYDYEYTITEKQSSDGSSSSSDWSTNDVTGDSNYSSSGS